MRRPQLTPVGVSQQEPGASLATIIQWARGAWLSLKTMSERLAEAAAAIQQLSEGQNTVTGTVTLEENATTTTVEKNEIPPGGHAFLTPKTANASAEFGNGTIYVATSVKGAFTITHANNGQTDREFGWVVFKAG